MSQGNSEQAAKPAQHGFGLVEVLIAMVVVSLLAISLFQFLGGQSTATSKGNDLARGMHLGKEKLDSLRVTDWRYVTAGSDTVNSKFIRAWTIGTASGRKQVVMTVFWPLAAKHSVTMNTIISDDQYKVMD